MKRISVIVGVGLMLAPNFAHAQLDGILIPRSGGGYETYTPSHSGGYSGYIPRPSDNDTYGGLESRRL